MAVARVRTGLTWLVLLGGMLVWAAHFFSLYAFASIWESGAPARWGTAAATVAGLAANLWLLRYCVRLIREDGSVGAWASRLGAFGAALSLVAVAWQGLPAAFG